jgi:hypothetical protein
MRYFALYYELVDNFLSRRSAFRDEHLRLARGASPGRTSLGGRADRALLVFRAAESSIVEQFARNDLYVTSRLVTRWEVRSLGRGYR